MIVQEKRAKLQGEVVDDLGWFNPHTNSIKLDREKLKHWLGNGAQPTESAQKVIDRAGDDSGIRSFEGRKSSKKRKKDKREKETASPAEAQITETPAAKPAAEESPVVSPEETQKEEEKVE